AMASVDVTGAEDGRRSGSGHAGSSPDAVVGQPSRQSLAPRPRPMLAFPLLSSQNRAVSGVTHILGRLEQGDAKAAEELLPLVYDELRRLAASKMANEAPGHTLQPTALVHEAWLRLGGSEAPPFQNRAHFFGAAAEA